MYNTVTMSGNANIRVAVKALLSAQQLDYQGLQARKTSKKSVGCCYRATTFSIILVKAETIRPELNY